MGEPRYWLPSWWGWTDQDWSRCRACLEYNHVPCVSCEVPPGLLAIACLVGGGTGTVAGGMRGNFGIANMQQAEAAARVSGADAVNRQLERQTQSIDVMAEVEDVHRLKELKERNQLKE